jgi:peptidoglycan hydrolase-like protein with peptidoglycan-binding domain
MAKRLIIFAVLAIFTISLTGCATAPKQKDLEIQGLRNQISVLEAQLQSKDEEINSLKASQTKAREVKEVPGVTKISKKKVIGEVKSRPKVRQIQVALKNAGFEPGIIDGRMGKQTREALKAFQKANNLPADGKIGKKTWSLLREYLYKKVK